MSDAQGEYEAEERRTLAEAPGLRVRLLSLSAGQTVPWHAHTFITDRFFCMRGPMEVRTRRPEAVHVLQAGETLDVPPGSPHFVSGSGGGPCRFMLVQGVGEYDYVPVAP